MDLKKFLKSPDIFNLRPAAGGDRGLIQIVNAGCLQCRQKGRMGSNDELTTVKQGGILQRVRLHMGIALVRVLRQQLLPLT